MKGRFTLIASMVIKSGSIDRFSVESEGFQSNPKAFFSLEFLKRIIEFNERFLFCATIL